MSTIDQIIDSLYTITHTLSVHPDAIQHPTGTLKDAIDHIRREADLIGVVTADTDSDDLRPEERAVLTAVKALKSLDRPAAAIRGAAILAERGRAAEERGRANYAASQEPSPWDLMLNEAERRFNQDF